MRRKTIIRTPGKLMVAGEFAVLERDHSLIVMAVDRYIYATIKNTPAFTFTSENYGLHNIKWNFDGKTVTFQRNHGHLRFIQEALTVVCTYLNEQHVTLSPFTVTIESELDEKDTGAKYGLGSSAAVVTAIVAAVANHFLKESLSKDVIFKLAAIAHVRTQGSGSGADIAASTYGGLLHYRSFQADWLLEELKETISPTEIIHKNWPYLHIKKVNYPESLNVYIGWTGKPASTTNLVKQVTNFKGNNKPLYEQFLTASEQAVDYLLKGMERDDSQLFLRGVKENRQALSNLGKRAGAPIETAKLAQLSDVAERLHGAGKMSGAGGGDCGIAFLDTSVDSTLLFKAWEQATISPLEMKVDYVGTIRL